MEKKDIYEHLAKIYLDASLKRKKKPREYLTFKNLFFISAILALALIVSLAVTLNKNRPLKSEMALVLCPDVVKINFHFDSAKKEFYSIKLNKLDMTRFKSLGFALKKLNRYDRISLRVEFASAFKERSEIYIKDMPAQWQDYNILLSDFKNISDWSEMLSISFVVEEWNTRENKGIVYIDNIGLIK